MMKIIIPFILGLLLLSGCEKNQPSQTIETPIEYTINPDLPIVSVYKHPACGCCGAWEDYMREHGYYVIADTTRNMHDFKVDLRIDFALSSCHTSLIDGYIVEGHVPVDAIERLLEERPEALGITVPGMPIGSPGMEGMNPQPFDVLLLHRDGSNSVFQSYVPQQ
jgi:hypothetical protein